jgi:hypothetical protein
MTANLPNHSVRGSPTLFFEIRQSHSLCAAGADTDDSPSKSNQPQLSFSPPTTTRFTHKTSSYASQGAAEHKPRALQEQRHQMHEHGRTSACLADLLNSARCWEVTRNIRMTVLTQVRVLNTFKYKVRAQRDCDSLYK